MGESVQKQKKRYGDFLKLLSCFDRVVENAIGIEVHNRNGEYKDTPDLKNVYVLVSAFQDGDRIVPVKLEIKEFFTNKSKFYVAITLESIQKGEIVMSRSSEKSFTSNTPSPTVSIAQLFRHVNPSDESFRKYIPAEFLTEPPATAPQAARGRAPRAKNQTGMPKEKWNARQRATFEAASVLAGVLGTDIILHASFVRKGKRLLSENGKIWEAPNGWYTQDGVIHIDINAGMKGQGRGGSREALGGAVCQRQRLHRHRQCAVWLY